MLLPGIYQHYIKEKSCVELRGIEFRGIELRGFE
jgi:hypothetical protein